MKQRPVPLEKSGNCANPRYAHLFTGERREERLKILNFVPVGYNIRLLEAMLHELYDAVDYFVLYESDTTQIGMRKAAFFNASRHRWHRFEDKIIYLYDHIDNETADYALSKNCISQFWDLEVCVCVCVCVCV